jgi:hypothetical protein
MLYPAELRAHLNYFKYLRPYSGSGSPPLASAEMAYGAVLNTTTRQAFKGGMPWGRCGPQVEGRPPYHEVGQFGKVDRGGGQPGGFDAISISPPTRSPMRPPMVTRFSSPVRRAPRCRRGPVNRPFTISVQRMMGRTNVQRFSTMAETWISHAGIAAAAATEDASGSDRP